jgi:hypothetical protein
MTVHNWINSFGLGEERKMPSNVTQNDVVSYGWSRFGWQFIKVGADRIKRVCPKCFR